MNTNNEELKISRERAEDAAIFTQKIEENFLNSFLPDKTFLLSLEELDIPNPYTPSFIARLQLRKIRGFSYANAILKDDTLNGFPGYALQGKDVWVFAVNDSERTRNLVTQTLYDRHNAHSVSYVVRYPEIKIYESDN